MKHLIRFLEIYISQRLKKCDNKLIQEFVFGKGKDKHFIKDKRFLIYDKFEKQIRNKLIISDTLLFSQRINKKDRVVFEYEIIGENTIENNMPFFIIAEFIPPDATCEFCIYREKGNGLFIKCNLKKKMIQGNQKNCKFFKQKRI